MDQGLTSRDREAIRLLLVRVRELLGDPETSAAVFGSKARGEAGADSDIDLLLVVGHDDLPVRRQIFDLAFDVFLETDVLISPLVVSRETLADLKRSRRRLIRDIERDGMPV